METKLSNVIGKAFYQLHTELKAGKHDEVWLKGGRGGLKSSFVSVEIVLGIIADECANAICMRRYETELRDSVYSQIKWAIYKLGIDHLFTFNVSPMQIIYNKTGQRIIFHGADNPGKAKSFNIGKGYIKYAWFEEVDQYPGYADIRTILQTLFRGGEHKRIAFFSFNPPKSGRAWVNQEVKNPKTGRAIHHSTYLDVPREWLGERFIVEAEHLKRVNESAYRHEYMGEEVGTGLEVFTNIEVRKITDDEIAGLQQIRQGLDFGYAVDPVCFTKSSYDRKRRRLYIFGEVAGIEISNRKLASLLSDDEKRRHTYADRAEPKSIDELRDYGLNIDGAKKGPDSVEYGIKWLQDLEAIIIDPERCRISAKEFQNYALDISRSGDVISRFPDKDNHAIDSIRYALVDDMQDGGSYKAPAISASRLGL